MPASAFATVAWLVIVFMPSWFHANPNPVLDQVVLKMKKITEDNLPKAWRSAQERVFMCFFADLGLFRRSTPSTSSGYPPMGPVSQVYFQSLWPIPPTVPQGLAGVTTGAMTPPTIDSPPCSSGGEGSALSGMSSLAQVGFLLIPCSLLKHHGGQNIL